MRRPEEPAKVLVTGWFSFPYHHATAGDLLACDVLCRWLEDAEVAYDVSWAAPFQGGVDWRRVRREDYSHLVFVCGPVGPTRTSVVELLERFASLQRIAVNVTMQEPLELWNPFDVLIERDSSSDARPDLTFGSDRPVVPVVGVVLVEPYPPEEFPGRDAQRTARDAIDRLLQKREAAVVAIDTRVDANATGLRTPTEVESVIARMDVVVTTRLHGLVLALKNGVPSVAVDPVAGGGKILAQARAVGWPIVFTSDSLEDVALRQALDFCLSDEGRSLAAECGRSGRQAVAASRDEFLHALGVRGRSIPPGSGASVGVGPWRAAGQAVSATAVVLAETGRSDLLSSCLAALRACAPRAAELVVVDPSPECRLSAAAAAERSGASIVAASGRTMGAALNDALRLASNEIVLMTHDDCVPAASWAATAWRLVARDPTALITGQVLPLDDSRRVPSNIHSLRSHGLPRLTTWGDVDLGVMAFHRDRVLALGGFDERLRLAHDLDLVYRWRRSHAHVHYAPDLLVWRRHWRTERQLSDHAKALAAERGAFYGMRVRSGDSAALRLAAGEARAGVRSVAAAVRRGRKGWSDPRRGILGGLPAGFARGLLHAAPKGI